MDSLGAVHPYPGLACAYKSGMLMLVENQANSSHGEGVEALFP